MLPKTRTSQLQASDFQTRTPYEHIYKQPDMYLGSDAASPKMESVLRGGTVATEEVVLSSAAKRIFMEFLSNAIDNVIRTRDGARNPGTIKVTMDSNSVSIYNEGDPFPVEEVVWTDTVEKSVLASGEVIPARTVTKKQWLPQKVFTQLHASSNFSEGVERTVVGMNGVGATAGIIFSTSATVAIVDAVRHKSYVQVFENNLKKICDPVITKTTAKTSSVTLTYVLDFARFGMTSWNPDATALFGRMVAEASLVCRIPTRFNEFSWNFTSAKDFGKMLYPNLDEAKMFYFSEGVKPSGLPTTEVLLLDVPGGRVFSYVNGIETPDGGVHVDAVLKVLAAAVTGFVSSSQDEPCRLELRDFRRYVSFVLVCNVPSPKFLGQHKSRLESPVPPLGKFTSKALAPLKSWDLVEVMRGVERAAEMKVLGKGDGNNRRAIASGKGEFMANLAGKESSRCSLILVEGNSAALYIQKLIAVMNNKDVWGTLPLRGKVINMINASVESKAKNREYEKIRKFLNFRTDLDYSLDENFRTLHYHKILLCTDADVDGIHISSLLMNLLNEQMKTLFSRPGFVSILRTPLLRLTKSGKPTINFYDQESYEAWMKEGASTAGYTIKYFKGLASSNDKNVEEDSKEFAKNNVVVVRDAAADDSLSVAFDRLKTDLRKTWLKTYETFTAVQKQSVTVSRFIFGEFSKFMQYNLGRMLPSGRDGLKTSERKVIHTMFYKFASSSPHQIVKTSGTSVKLAVFDSIASEHTNYHHGQNILGSVAAHMSQNFVGAPYNNMPIFYGDGQFGSRESGPSVMGQFRYVFVEPSWWINYVFRKEDFKLLTPQYDEGEAIEPEFFLTVIPLLVVNGSLGIGSGYSTYLPPHNPKDVIAWLLARLQGETPETLTPWFRGFEGTVKLISSALPKDLDAGLKEEPTEVPPSPGDESDPSTKIDLEGLTEEARQMAKIVKSRPRGTAGIKQSMISSGKYTVDPDSGDIHVTELPVGLWTEDYVQWLQKMTIPQYVVVPETKTRKQVRLLTEVVDHSASDSISITIRGMTEPSKEKLRLVKGFSLTNMNVLDARGHPQKYDSADAIMEEWYQFRLGFYEKRKESILDGIRAAIEEAETRLKFLVTVVHNKIQIVGVSRKSLSEELAKYGYMISDLTKVSSSDFTNEHIQEVKDSIETLKRDLEEKEKTVTAKNLWIEDLRTLEEAYLANEKETSKARRVVKPAAKARRKATKK